VIELTVNDMTCGHCASTIARAVKNVDAVARCEIDIGAKRVRITSARPAGDFVTSIQEAGYTPVVSSQEYGAVNATAHSPAAGCCGARRGA
jgi:copper chaperone